MYCHGDSYKAFLEIFCLFLCFSFFSIISISLYVGLRSLHVQEPPRKPVCYKFNVTVSANCKPVSVNLVISICFLFVKGQECKFDWLMGRQIDKEQKVK